MDSTISANVWLCIGLAACLAASGYAEDCSPKLVSVDKIWDAAPHNAFTDLVRFQDQWFCTFREGERHVYGEDGRIRIIVSRDGEHWTPAALLAEEGVDLRDPKLSIMPDGRLMILAGGSVYEGETYMGRQPRVAFSKDGHDWGPLHRILGEGEWLWRVTWHKGKGYGVTRMLTITDGKKHTDVRLVVTTDGLAYEEITGWDIHDRPNETTLRFIGDDEMMAMVRREEGDHTGWLGTSKPPYTDWDWHQTEHRFGGPNFIQLPDGSLWGASRYYPGGAKTVLARMTPTSYEPVLTLPSGGDTSYPGLVWHDDLLWMSYYASHEEKTSIYLAKISIPLSK
ncbi:MAG TPA: exo-alpha-sialidase [Candidatus Hydrogenedentes bacterium]|nr:exo-alpha-sialidase [Candidatus Hydrogenedentota bacterium]